MVDAAAFLRFLVRRDVAVEVFDDGGVERFLRVERRPDHSPDEAAKAALQRPIDRGRPRRQHVPGLIDRREFRRVVAGRWVREIRHPPQRAVERRQRLVVRGVGGLPLLLESSEAVGQALCVVTVAHAANLSR
jgi:hypothetical protein